MSSILSPELVALTVSGIIGAGVGVASTFIVQSYLNRPKIRARVLNMVSSLWISSQVPDMSKGVKRTAYLVYVYLTNYHQNSIYVLDYELEIDFGNGFQRMKRVYGDVSKAVPDPMIGTDRDGNTIEVRGLSKRLIYGTLKSVQFGDFVHGLIMFASDDAELYKKKSKEIRLTCIDVFKKRHVVRTTPDKFELLPLLQETLDFSDRK